MRFMVMVMSPNDDTAASKAQAAPTEAMLIEMGKFNDELIKAGVMVSGEGLTPEKALRVAFNNGKATVKDGPYTEAKEVIGGFWILQVKSQDELLSWIKRAPFDEASLHIRRISDPEDFAGMVSTDEGRKVVEAEQAYRARENAEVAQRMKQ